MATGHEPHGPEPSPIPVHYLYELAWLLPSIALPVACLVAILITAYGIGIQVPGDAGRICATQIDRTQPFDRLGLFPVGAGQYEARLTAQIWSFTPSDFTIPAGSTITFVATSRDVIHGFMIHEANLNVMVVPGEISRVSHRFERPGDYPILCHEYCGIGHHQMWGQLHVVKRKP